jgi:hypothetical protein
VARSGNSSSQGLASHYPSRQNQPTHNGQHTNEHTGQTLAVNS